MFLLNCSEGLATLFLLIELGLAGDRKAMSH
jgi:hypothetical protein